jgi:hypothetical protein
VDSQVAEQLYKLWHIDIVETQSAWKQTHKKVVLKVMIRIALFTLQSCQSFTRAVSASLSFSLVISNPLAAFFLPQKKQKPLQTLAFFPAADVPSQIFLSTKIIPDLDS